MKILPILLSCSLVNTVFCDKIIRIDDRATFLNFNCRTNVYEKSKQNYLEKAHNSRIDANNSLEECLKYASFVPNLDLRAQMNALITSAIGSFRIPLVKDKFHFVFLALLTQATVKTGNEFYDSYQSLKFYAGEATKSLEEQNVFLSLALSAEVYHHPDIDYHTYYYDLSEEMENAIQYLIIAEIHACSMFRPQDANAITNECYIIKKNMMNEISQHGHITTPHRSDILKMIEGCKKIAKTAVEDKETINCIIETLENAAECLEIVEHNIFED